MFCKDKPKKPPIEQKIEDAQRILKTFRFTGIRLYFKKDGIKWFNRTKASNIKSRSEIVLLSSEDRAFHDIRLSIPATKITSVHSSVELDVCLELLSQNKEVGSLYLSRHWHVLQVGNDFFTLTKDSSLQAAVEKALKEKFRRKNRGV